MGVEDGRLGVAALWRWRRRGSLVGGGALDLWLRDLGTKFGERRVGNRCEAARVDDAAGRKFSVGESNCSDTNCQDPDGSWRGRITRTEILRGIASKTSKLLDKKGR